MATAKQSAKSECVDAVEGIRVDREDPLAFPEVFVQGNLLTVLAGLTFALSTLPCSCCEGGRSGFKAQCLNSGQAGGNMTL